MYLYFIVLKFTNECGANYLDSKNIHSSFFSYFTLILYIYFNALKHTYKNEEKKILIYSFIHYFYKAIYYKNKLNSLFNRIKNYCNWKSLSTYVQYFPETCIMNCVYTYKICNFISMYKLWQRLINYLFCNENCYLLYSQDSRWFM